MILVRWYDSAEHEERHENLSSSMRKLRCATMRGDSQQHVPWINVKLLSALIKPVLMQEHPTQPDTFVDNKFA